MKKNILSLFDGHSGLQIALNESGIKYDKYFASETDKYAMQVTQAIYPKTDQLGDILNWKKWILPKIDLIVFGSPCQGFSIAGKRLNFEDPRSKLFFVALEILNFYKPKYFIMENVNRMDKKIKEFISRELKCSAIMIDSNLVSAQNRERLYWTNIPGTKKNIFGGFCIDQPKDKKIFLKDILQPENEVDKKYRLSEKLTKKLFENSAFIDINGKAPTQRASTGRCLDEKHNYQFIKIDKSGSIKNNQNKASTLTGGGHSGGNHSDMDLLLFDLKTVTGTSKTRRGGIYNKKAPTLDRDCYLGILKNLYIRRVTPRECGRAQTIPEHILDIMLNCGVSNSQLYKMFGNGFTIGVICHILKGIK